MQGGFQLKVDEWILGDWSGIGKIRYQILTMSRRVKDMDINYSG